MNSPVTKVVEGSSVRAAVEGFGRWDGEETIHGGGFRW